MRRQNDFYPTPAWATEELLKRISVRGTILECCAGDGAIADVMSREIDSQLASAVWTNDIDGSRNCHFTFDASIAWPLDRVADWVITNPPFNSAAKIVPLAYEHAALGIAMLLRLSFLEPVEDRGAWLNEHPPTSMIVLPRISFTGDGNTDSVTCAWMVWEKSKQGTITVAGNPKFIKLATNDEPLFATA